MLLTTKKIEEAKKNSIRNTKITHVRYQKVSLFARKQPNLHNFGVVLFI